MFSFIFIFEESILQLIIDYGMIHGVTESTLSNIEFLTAYWRRINQRQLIKVTPKRRKQISEKQIPNGNSKTYYYNVKSHISQYVSFILKCTKHEKGILLNNLI